MRFFAFCVYFVAVVSVKFCHASTCSNETEPEAYDDKLDIAMAKITKIMKETCSCPMYGRPADCEEVLKNGNTVSGVYTIYPKKPLPGCESLKVYCDMETDGGGWIVIQRRGDPMTPDDFFNQDWATYKAGFGELTKEFWLGNENLFALTNQGHYMVRVDLRNSKGEEKYAVYDTFALENEKQNYKLRIGGYSGNAGNSFYNHNGRWFYTKDKPNVYAKSPFRSVPNSGWWYNVFPSTNLNGLKKTAAKDGIVWYTFGGYAPPLAFSEMKLRLKPL